MSFPRGSGILLHPTSLPGDFGIGDLGPEAFRFVDVLATTGQKYWQILPLGPTGYGDSPYQCFSAFAGNILLISPEKLIDEQLLTSSDIASRPEMSAEKVDYGAVYEWKRQLILPAFENAWKGSMPAEFDQFCREKAWWLDDYALYRALSQRECKPWFEWPEEIKSRAKSALRSATEQLAPKIEAEKFYQFLFFRQWLNLRKYANEKDIKIIGDIPIFAALDSGDVWCNQDEFKLNDDGSPRVVSGVPPDHFSETGQLWGNPIYDWNKMLESGFRWWVERVRSTLEMVDIVRVDHFRGLVSAWEVRGRDKTAENGEWVAVPGRELFTALRKALGDFPVIAEDLGFVTPEVEKLRDSVGFPGMRILQNAFGGDAKNHDLPHNYIQNCVAYTGTHDNDTIVGWFNSLAEHEAEGDEGAGRAREHCLKYLDSTGEEINWEFIRAIWASVAHIPITPMQDFLGLGTKSQMTLPATTSGNWQWRMTNSAITDDTIDRLKALTEIYGR